MFEEAENIMKRLSLIGVAMNKTAFIFKVLSTGMGREFYDNFKESRKI